MALVRPQPLDLTDMPAWRNLVAHRTRNAARVSSSLTAGSVTPMPTGQATGCNPVTSRFDSCRRLFQISLNWSQSDAAPMLRPEVAAGPTRNDFLH